MKNLKRLIPLLPELILTVVLLSGLNCILYKCFVSHQATGILLIPIILILIGVVSLTITIRITDHLQKFEGLYNE